MNRQEMALSVAEVVQEGGVAVSGDQIGLIEFTALTADGEAELHQIGFPYYSAEVKTLRGLKMTGVMRRSRLMRHFTECNPVDVRKGDKIVLQDEEENMIKTTRIKRKITEPSSIF